jgi:hypothetical protein
MAQTKMHIQMDRNMDIEIDRETDTTGYDNIPHAKPG